GVDIATAATARAAVIGDSTVGTEGTAGAGASVEAATGASASATARKPRVGAGAGKRRLTLTVQGTGRQTGGDEQREQNGAHEKLQPPRRPDTRRTQIL